ncbi:hypothetical protein MHYP_G00253260 [Metynnis hypsauchen]
MHYFYQCLQSEGGRAELRRFASRSVRAVQVGFTLKPSGAQSRSISSPCLGASSAGASCSLVIHTVGHFSPQNVSTNRGAPFKMPVRRSEELRDHRRFY